MHPELNTTPDLTRTSSTTSPFLPRVVEEQPQVGFRVDDRGHGFNLLFVTAEMLTQSPFTPLWMMECGDRETLRALARWTAVRRHRWADWATLAQTFGPLDFSEYMFQLLADEPPMHVTDTMVETRTESNEVVFTQLLGSGTTRASEEVVRHRFASAEGMASFARWLNADGLSARSEQLVGLAFGAGTDAFGDLLEELAQAPVPSRQQRRRAERNLGR